MVADSINEIPSRKVVVSSVPKFTLVVDVVGDICEQDQNACDRAAVNVILNITRRATMKSSIPSNFEPCPYSMVAPMKSASTRNTIIRSCVFMEPCITL